MTAPVLLTRVARGAASGAAASTAMGVVFLGARRLGVVSKLAPEEITETALDTLGTDLPKAAEDAVTTAAHIGYGAAAGAAYGLIRPFLPGPNHLAGLSFAAAVLLASYEGWVPAARVLAPLHQQTPGGRSTLIAGHAVYGLVLGRLTG